MAGCLPQYFPLLMLAIEAMCEKPFNLYAIQATTHQCAPLTVEAWEVPGEPVPGARST